MHGITENKCGTLLVFGGLPGCGKTTLARCVAAELSATYIRIDTIEHAVKHSMLQPDDVIDTGYTVGCALAKDNITIGNNVVTDAVNPIAITRDAWKQIATETQCTLIQVEIICTDLKEHQHRVETRAVSLPQIKLPTWSEVIERDYEIWHDADIIIDTAGRSVAKSSSELMQAIEKLA